jgi:competence protein ComEC
MKPLHFPLTRITLFFILGILVGFYGKINLFWTSLLLIFGILIFLFSFFKNKFFGVSCFILSFFIGITTQVFHANIWENYHYTKQIGSSEKPHLLEVTLKEKLKNTYLNTRFIATVNQFDSKKSCGKIIFNIRKDSLFHDFEIGTKLKLQSTVYKNREMNNPNQFDYGQYLENQQVYAQVYADVEELKISPNIQKDAWYYTAKFRNRIIHNLEKTGFCKKELAVVNALILGQQQDISADVLQDYQFAGAIHILSVSGLHVGFIMLFIGFLLKPIPNHRKGKLTKLIITLLSIWIFGFIAGFAPSILRSVVMFSFVAIGKFMGRAHNIFHTLLVSALLILLFKPSFLFDVGFQLSYISLFFIVWLQPYFASFWTPKYKFINFFWEILTVSFAAQVGAFPLSMYYFHQFPGLFFVTNLLILPLIGFVMGYAVVIMFLAFFDILPHFLMKILEISVWILDEIIAFIASFEQFIIQNIPINGYILFSLYLMIIGLIIYFKDKKFNKLVFALATIILFQISLIGTKYYHQNQKELIVFNIKKNSLIAVRNGQNTTVYANDSILKNIGKESHLKSYIVGNFSRIKNKKLLANLLFFNNNKILIIDSIAVYPTNISPDVLLITNSPKLNLERFLQNCKPKIVVADASNFKSSIKIWQTTCEQQKIPFHATTEKGFYRISRGK